MLSIESNGFRCVCVAFSFLFEIHFEKENRSETAMLMSSHVFAGKGG